MAALTRHMTPEVRTIGLAVCLCLFAACDDSDVIARMANAGSGAQDGGAGGASSGGTAGAPSNAAGGAAGGGADASVDGGTADADGATTDGGDSDGSTGPGGGTTLVDANPVAIAIDATSVYWIDLGGAVMKMPLGGGAPVRLVSTAVGLPGGIAVDATSVYYTGERAAWKVGLGGGAPVKLGVSLSFLGPIAVDATSVYWADPDDTAIIDGFSDTNPDPVPKLMKLPLAGGAAVPLASGESPGAIAVDATSVYWTNNANGTVMKMAVGGGAPVIVASGQSHPGAIAVDATNVYWTNTGPSNVFPGGSVMRVPLGGGTPLIVAPGQQNPVAISVGASSVYWTNNGLPGESGAVMKVALSGGTPIALASGQQAPIGSAVNATFVYWGTSSAIMRAPIDGGVTAPPTPPNPVTSSHPLTMTIDATHAYWVDFEGTILKAPLAGGAPVALASRVGDPAAIAVDATNVYWTNSDNGNVMKVPIGGGTPTAFASAQRNPGAIALDAASVYWTTSRAVMKAPRGGGGTPIQIAQVSSDPFCGTGSPALAVDATNAYWATYGTKPQCADANLMTVPFGGGTSAPAAAGRVQFYEWGITPVSSMAFAIDATSIYWGIYDGTTGNGRLMKVGLGGGTPVTLASGQWDASAIAVDATSVYWTVTRQGPVDLMKVARTGGPATVLTPLQSGDVYTSIAVDATSVYWMRPGSVAAVMKVPK